MLRSNSPSASTSNCSVGESHADFLRTMRERGTSAMQMLLEQIYEPRLVGPVLVGTADENSSVNLHVFADSPEAVAMRLTRLGYNYRPYERRLKSQPRSRRHTGNVRRLSI